MLVQYVLLNVAQGTQQALVVSASGVGGASLVQKAEYVAVCMVE